MKTAVKYIKQEIENIKEAGTYKEERIITSPQSSRIDTTDKKQVLNMCANNYLGLADNPDLITAAKEALGGASGGYTSSKKEIIQLLRQQSRPYLFSNTLAPSISAAALSTLQMLSASTQYRDKVHENTQYFREQISKIGFAVLPGSHPIVPIMLYDAKVSSEFAKRMLEKGVYVIGFSYPVVSQGKARIRTQVSAAHTKEDLDSVVSCFKQVKEEMGL